MYKNFTYSQLSELLMSIAELLDSDEWIPKGKFAIYVKAFNLYERILTNARDTDTTESVFNVPVIHRVKGKWYLG